MSAGRGRGRRLGCSNRTFMELKLVKDIPFEPREPSSNRTFMELKFNEDSEKRLFFKF